MERLDVGIDSRYRNTLAVGPAAEAFPKKSFLSKIKDSITVDSVKSGLIGAAIGIGVKYGVKTFITGIGVAAPLAGVAAGAAAGAALEMERQYQKENHSSLFGDILRMRLKGTHFHKGRIVSSAIIGGVGTFIGGAVLDVVADNISHFTNVVSAQTLSPNVEIQNTPVSVELARPETDFKTFVTIQQDSNPWNTIRAYQFEVLGHQPSPQEIHYGVYKSLEISGLASVDDHLLPPGTRLYLNS